MGRALPPLTISQGFGLKSESAGKWAETYRLSQFLKDLDSGKYLAWRRVLAFASCKMAMLIRFVRLVGWQHRLTVDTHTSTHEEVDYEAEA